MTTEADLSTPVDIDLAEQQLAIARRRLRWERNKSILAPIVNALAKQGLEPSMRDDDVNVSFTGDAAKLKAALEVITGAGYVTGKERPKPGDTQWYARFNNLQCQVDIWLNFSSSVCIRKKVGTTMVEQDVFETICGDCTVEAMQLPTPAPVLEESVF